jgi:stearoyl-CoA desaturase (delta-9 desaturase)
VPTLACGLLFGDYWGGYFVAGVARLVFVHHSTFFVNSLAHWAGDATYTDGHTARNSWITALVTLGEGYHNFHHEFPSDYRNGVEWWQYDPTKVFIYAASCLGLAYNLQLFPAEEIIKGQLQMNQKALAARMERLYWGPDPGALKVLTQKEFEAGVERGEAWMVIDGFVCDCAKWGASHPGGEGYIKSWVGKDATAAFKGETYKHSNAAQNVAATLRVARIADYWAK